MSKKQSKKQETGMDRLKKVPLWQWGAIAIFAGIISYLVMGMQAPAGGTTAARRGAEMGRAMASLIFIIAGGVMIAMHFRRNQK
jgi:hypothetical protein